MNHSSYQPLATDYSLTPRTPHSRAGRFEIPDIPNSPDSGDHQAPTEWQAPPFISDDPEESKDHGNLNALFRRIILVIISLTLSMVVLALFKAAANPKALAAYFASSTEKNTSNQTGPPTEPHDYKFISYQNYTNFPLTPSQYRTECTKIMSGYMANFPYWADGNMDVPHSKAGMEVGQGLPSCKSTITYMLGREVGLLADLALMAQAASLASERNRTFLIDDTYWNRGKWSDYFEDVRDVLPGPEPGCRAPPPEELVACPRTARHWVINSQTSKFHFGHPFSEAYEDPYAMNINRLKPIYRRAQNSFSEFFRPKADLANLIQKARLEFANTFAQSGSSEYVSVHVRRGDRMGMSWKYHTSHLPIELYAKAVEATWTRLNLTSSNSDQPVVYFASDSPSVLEEFTDHLPSDARVYSLPQSEWTDLRKSASPQPYIQSDFDQLVKDERIRLTKGMLVDFALLSGLWNEDQVGLTHAATICGLSSNVCKMSALGLGWDRAFGDLENGIDEERKRWVEIDNAGAILPLWEAFEVFS